MSKCQSKNSCGCSGSSPQTTVLLEERPLAIDPVCSMKVNPTRAAASYEFEGTTYYFCHPGCKTKFVGKETYYLSGQHKIDAERKAADAPAGTIYFCPMHPEVQAERMEDCPKCGMALEPVGGSDDGTDPELEDMSRRLKFALSFTAPLVIVSMGSMILMPWLHEHLNHELLNLVQMFLAIPVVFLSGSVFFKRAWQSVKNKSPNMFTLIGAGVGTAFLYSLVVSVMPGILPDSLMGHGGVPHVYFEASAVIITLALLGQVLECRARAKTTEAIKNLAAMAPETAIRVEDDGTEIELKLEHVRVGDVLKVVPGSRVALDGTILSGSSSVDESMITGEPIPNAKTVGDTVIGGTTNGLGTFHFRVERAGKDTVLARIIALAREAQLTRAPIQSLADKVSGYFVPAVAAISLLTFLTWFFIGPSPALIYALLSAVSVLIIACPCALGLAAPMSMTVGIGEGASAGILTREARALEVLTTVDVVVLDKTGTLTEGRPVVDMVIPATNLSDDDLLQLAASAEAGSEHPLSKAILEANKRTLVHHSEFSAIPGLGISAVLEGKTVLVGSRKLMLSNSIACDIINNTETSKSTGYTAIYVAVDSQLAGAILVKDRIKANAAFLIEKLSHLGKKVVVLSGDDEATVKKVASELGIEEAHGSMMPEEKAAFIKDLKESGHHRVAMAGDGINDAPALALADVGIAMGDGSDIAADNADLVLVKGDLGGIIRAFTLSRAVMANIKTNLWLAFGYNALAIPIAAGLLFPIFGLLLNPMMAALAMSLSSVSVIANSLRLRRLKLKS